MKVTLKQVARYASGRSPEKMHRVVEENAMTDGRPDLNLQCNHEHARVPLWQPGSSQLRDNKGPARAPNGPETPSTASPAQQQTGTEEKRASQRASTGGQEGTQWCRNQATTGHRRPAAERLNPRHELDVSFLDHFFRSLLSSTFSNHFCQSLSWTTPRPSEWWPAQLDQNDQFIRKFNSS